MKYYKKRGLNFIKLIIGFVFTGILTLSMVSCEKTEEVETDLIEGSLDSEKTVRQQNLSGNYYIRNQFNRHYLGQNGSNVVTRESVKLQWKFVKDGKRSNGQQLYKIVSQSANNNVLDVEKRSTSNGANVHVFKNLSSNDDNQRWFVHYQVESDSYIISSQNGGKALDRNTTGFADNRNVHMWNYGGNENQRWILERP